MEAKKLENLSIADYIREEKETNTKYEYHDGKIFAVVGGTVEHGLISGNTYGEIKFELRKKGSDCKAINSDVKLHVALSNNFFAYRQIPTLKEYLLIDQYKAQVDVYKREADLWKITRIEGLEETFTISSLGIEISLANIYENIVFVGE